MKTLTKLLEGFAYQILISAATVVVWTLGLERIGLPILLGLLFLEYVFLEETTPTLPLLLNALFMVSQTEWSFDNVPLYLYLTPAALLLGMAIHAIRFRVHLLHGAMLPGVLVMLAAAALSTLNAGATLSWMYGFYAVVGLLYAFVYLFYVNTITGDRVRHLIRTLFLLSIVVSVEVLIYYLRVDDVIVAIENKSIDLGWGISNYVATYLILFTPMTFYYAKTAKFPFAFLLLAAFEGTMLLFTASRGGIIAFAGTFGLCSLYLLIQKSWWKSALRLSAAIGALALAAWIGHDFFLTLYDRLAQLLLDDSGRIPIWLEAIDKFRQHPLFGNGIFARLDENGDYRMFHDTVLHTAATFGLVGLAGLAMQVYVQFKWTLKGKTAEGIILAIALLGAHMHGLVDNIYYMPQFMIVIVIIVAVCENAFRKDPAVAKA